MPHVTVVHGGHATRSTRSAAARGGIIQDSAYSAVWAEARSTVLPDLTLDNLCVPTTSSTSCDQAIFVDQASDVGLFPDAVVVEIDRLG